MERAHRRWAAEGRAAKTGRIPKDRLIAELAGLQLGVVARRQLLAMGIGSGAIETRVRKHYLHPLHRGVYAVGHLALMPLARETAAVLAAGPEAVVSHRSAAAVWHLLREDNGEDVDVTIRRRGGGVRPGLRVHRSRLLAKRDVRHLRGLPVTSPARTIIDLAEVASGRELERALDEAVSRRLLDARRLRADTDAYNGRRGIARLRRLLEGDHEPAITRSAAEERFLALIAAAGLPRPEGNVRIQGHEVDFLWRGERLVVEVDGFRFHSSRSAFERDRRRDAELQSAGLRVLRVTWRQIVDEPYATLVYLVRALAL